MKSFAVLALASCLTVVTASVYPTIDPDSIDDSTKENLCVQQTASCESLCQDEFQGIPETNDCSNDLDWRCICPGGLSPNTSEYYLPVPYYLCTGSVQECSNNCGGDSTCSEDCRKRKCGPSNPTLYNITTTKSTSTPTGSQSGYPSSTGADASPTTNVFNNLASSLTNVGSIYGFGAIVVGMAIGFLEVL